MRTKIWAMLVAAVVVCDPGQVLAQAGNPEMTDEQKQRTNLGPCVDDKTKKPIPHAHIYRIDKVGVAGLPPGDPMRQREVARCACDINYKNLGGLCVVDQTKKPANKAECATIAGQRLKLDIKACDSPVSRCLQTWGAKKEGASCAVGALFVALAASMSPEPFTKPIAVPALGAAAANCGLSAAEVANQCAPTWGSCAEPYLKEHENAWDDRTKKCRARGP